MSETPTKQRPGRPYVGPVPQVREGDGLEVRRSSSPPNGTELVWEAQEGVQQHIVWRQSRGGGPFYKVAEAAGDPGRFEDITGARDDEDEAAGYTYVVTRSFGF